MLITKTDILSFWPISVNLDDARVNPYITRAEQNNLSAILGPELYYALSQAVIVPGDRFDKLLNGTVYKYGTNFNRQFPGVKQLLCAYAYAYLVSNNPIHVTRGGVNKKVGEQTENVDAKQAESKSQEAYSEAIRLEGEFYNWIYQVAGTYKEFNPSSPAKKSSFNFFNASRGSARYEFGPDYWHYENPIN